MDVNDSSNQFYDGAVILSPISDIIGLPVDQVNFLACQFFVILIGPFFIKYLNAHKTSPKTSHVVEIFVGLMLAYFCFGRQIIHIFAQSILCLLLMKVLRPGLMEKVVLIIAMAYLCVGHAYRLIYDYGGYTLDVTGPMMLNTQKLSSLAFGIKDGYDLKNGKKMSDNLQSKVVRKFPSLLEFASYMLSFHGLLCGPFCFYTDYIAFIEGKNFVDNDKQLNGKLCEGDKEKNREMHPSPYAALFSRLSMAIIFGLSTILVAPSYSLNLIKEPGFQYHSFLYKIYLIIMVTSIQRQRYYFGWKLGEAGNISAGMGYNTKSKEWDLIDNVNIWKVEFSTSLKVLVDNWNISTTYWLRYVIYERIRNIVPVFLFSAFWHGFYPGYYVTFCTGGLFIFTSRLVRGNIRPWFQSSKVRSYAYDTLTLLITRVAVAYLSFPFLVLEIWPTVFIYKNVFFFLHVGAAMLSLTVMVLRSVLANQKTSQN